MGELERKNKELVEEVEKLKREIKSLKSRRKYGVVWEEEKEPEKIVLECKEKLPILDDIKEKEIINDTDQPINILIEGDNYHALSVLNYTHRGIVDIIYIDPPFNVGKKTWKYNNNYVDKEDNYKHSKWLNFIKNRLVLAKNLLKDDGCLICAIDENELNTLGLLLEQIFPTFSIECIVVVHNPRGIQGDNFAYCHEYAYFVHPKGKYIGRKTREVEDQEYEPLKKWGGSSDRSPGGNVFYPIFFKDGQIVKIGTTPPDDFHPDKPVTILEDGTIEIWPIDENGEGKWRYANESLPDKVDSIRLAKVGGVFQVQLLKSEDRLKTVWTDTKYDANAYGTQLLKQILGPDADFPYPKSLYTVKDCIEIVCEDKPNAIILDYFAGSGTTGHAVMELNKTDGGKRTFILCTNNEGNICEDTCYPRIRNVINGYEYVGEKKDIVFEEKLTYRVIKNCKKLMEEVNSSVSKLDNDYDSYKYKVEVNKTNDSKLRVYGVKNVQSRVDGLGGNLKYYRTKLIDIDNISNVSDDQKITLTHEAGEMIALRENTFDEVEKNEWWQIFKDNNRYTAIYFKEDKSKLLELVKLLSGYGKPVALYVFSWGKNEYKNEFLDYPNIRVEDIPEPIIEVYKEINRLV
ncbi:MAG: hypothetical protein NC238_10400 [Dehalobacter sp.]|nr:hypothetical protein [Dehalobacter sp.]